MKNKLAHKTLKLIVFMLTMVLSYFGLTQKQENTVINYDAKIADMLRITFVKNQKKEYMRAIVVWNVVIPIHLSLYAKKSVNNVDD